MQDRALGNSTTTSSQSIARPHEGRNVWVVTAYAVSGLALFGVHDLLRLGFHHAITIARL